MRTSLIGSGLASVAAGIGLLVISKKLLQHKIDLQGKVVLITGGSRGFGLAMAEEFASKGAKLVLCARNEQELQRAHGKIADMGAEVITIPCDVTDPNQIQHLIKQATDHFGHIDILVNNAGIISVGPIQTLTQSDFEQSMNVIFWGSYNMTMAVLPHMLARKDGRIVNITSIGGLISVPHLLAYSSAKFALVGFSEGLREELARYRDPLNPSLVGASACLRPGVGLGYIFLG